MLALGWHGRSEHWRHHGRSYLFFAALATPLVVSVHSVVSWDFAAGILPGWHSTLFPPYFVAGAIHSGLAMVLTLLIPLRKILHLEDVIEPKHFRDVALLMIVTTLIIGYSYVIELFMAWYSGNLFEQQFAWWRLTGPWWPFYPLIVICNVLLPLLFVFKRIRSNMVLLFVISLFVNIGMWSERLWLVSSALAHDFLPHNWGWYRPTWVELTILNGSICLFVFGFLILAKFFPAAPMSDIKTDMEQEQPKKRYLPKPSMKPAELLTGVVGVYGKAADLLDAVDRVHDHALNGLETYTPLRVDELPPLLGRGKSPVRYWTLIGGAQRSGRRVCPGHRVGIGQQSDRRRQASSLHRSLLRGGFRGHDSAGGDRQPHRHVGQYQIAKMEDACRLRLAIQPGQIRIVRSRSSRPLRGAAPRARIHSSGGDLRCPIAARKPADSRVDGCPASWRQFSCCRCWPGLPWESGGTRGAPGRCS